MHPSLLTYCTNIHPGEGWKEVFSALREHVPAVKAAVSPRRPFPIGLRLSRRAASEMTVGDRARFREWLEEEDCFVPTLNGFPYGSFHGGRIKEQVYLPDWRSPERSGYTLHLADLLGEWLPEGIPGSISTVPLGFKTAVSSADDPAIRENLESVLAALFRMKEERGKTILLALEPEPSCLLETTQDVCRFFHDLAIPSELKAHLGVCFDCCHHAVEFEAPAEALARLRECGVPIAKVQVSSALRFDGARAAELSRLEEPCYLHQVVVRDGEGLTRFNDIPEALSLRTPAPGEEWRCHFHVPVFASKFGAAGTTRDFLLRLLPLLPKETLLEVETYTWDLLPEARLGGAVTDSVIRELRWVEERIDA